MADEQPAAKRVYRARDFSGATAIDRARHYYTLWADFEECLDYLVGKRKWLLITGPFQSGKSSLAFALAEAAKSQGWVSFVTTLTIDMVEIANDSTLSDTEAANGFFAAIAEEVEITSSAALKQVPSSRPGGWAQVSRMLRSASSGEPDVIWFLDEAALLNEIARPTITRALLSGLRTCKEQSRTNGAYRLRSFSLVGTAKTCKLLASAKAARVEAVGARQYVPSSPVRLHDSFNPFPPGLPISPLSLEKDRSEDYLRPADIEVMLCEYGREHRVSFRVSGEKLEGIDARAMENDRALKKLAVDIYELTSGYKGMVGSCCEYIQGNGILSFSRWKQDVRMGRVSSHVLNFKVYSRIVSNIPTYSQQLQQLILNCVYSPSSGQPYSEETDVDLVLPAVNDGVLSIDPGKNTISISSGMLLAAILQDCRQATYEEVPLAGTFEEAVRDSFRYMKPDRLSRDEVLNLNGQPSEYIWMSEFVLALKLVLERGYRAHKYVILVECKKRDKGGQRRVRLDMYLKNTGSPPKAFEIQAKGGPKTIRAHIIKSDKYRLLFTGCEMNYVYFSFGPDDGAKGVIEQESRNYPLVNCWYVHYLEQDKAWSVELLQESGWHCARLDVPSSYPEFQFAVRQS